MKKLTIFLVSVLVILGLAAGVSAVSASDVLSVLDDALAPAGPGGEVITSSEAAELINLLEEYLTGLKEQEFPLPDLVITGIEILPEKPVIDKDITAKVTVKNIGDETASLGADAICTVIKRVKEDGNVGAEIATICIGETIAAGNSFLFNFNSYPFQYAKGGTYEIYAFVDSTYKQVESNETNNEFTQAFQVYT